MFVPSLTSEHRVRWCDDSKTGWRHCELMPSVQSGACGTLDEKTVGLHGDRLQVVASQSYARCVSCQRYRSTGSRNMLWLPATRRTCSARGSCLFTITHATFVLREGGGGNLKVQARPSNGSFLWSEVVQQIASRTCLSSGQHIAGGAEVSSCCHVSTATLQCVTVMSHCSFLQLT